MVTASKAMTSQYFECSLAVAELPLKQEGDAASTCSGTTTRTSCTSQDGDAPWDELSSGASSCCDQDEEEIRASLAAKPPSPSPAAWSKLVRQPPAPQTMTPWAAWRSSAKLKPQQKEIVLQTTRELAPLQPQRVNSHNQIQNQLRVSAMGFVPAAGMGPMVVPMSMVHTTEYDFRNTNGLMKCLNAAEPLPTPEELSAKHLVIGELQRLVDDWVRLALQSNADAPVSENKAPAATLLFGGSWHLKVGLSDSDLDIVALLPKAVTPECFFGSLPEYLKQIPSVTKLVARSKAAVPILAFQLQNVRIDLLFARYTQNVVPKHLPIHSDAILAGMDGISIRSLSVPRVASLVLELVPNGCTFRACLRIIRLWAKRRGLFSNKTGFLGGISWTIMVAFVCQMLPKATISATVHHFFTVFSTWNWPTPVMIAKPHTTDNSNCTQWSPKQNHHDRAHLMPIITPGYPSVNSAVNVSTSTLRIMKEEFARGKMILDDMLAKGLSSPAVWQKLFVPTEFLVRYDHYLVVELNAQDEDELSIWADFVASRTRKLVETLQHTAPIQTIHPLPDLIQPTAATGYYLIGYSVPPTAGGRATTSVPASDVAETCVSSALRYFLATELDTCAEKTKTMNASIQYRKWQQLPESVFPQGRLPAAGERAKFMLAKAHSMHVSVGLGR